MVSAKFGYDRYTHNRTAKAPDRLGSALRGTSVQARTRRLWIYCWSWMYCWQLVRHSHCKIKKSEKILKAYEIWSIRWISEMIGDIWWLEITGKDRVVSAKFGYDRYTHHRTAKALDRLWSALRGRPTGIQARTRRLWIYCWSWMYCWRWVSQNLCGCGCGCVGWGCRAHWVH